MLRPTLAIGLASLLLLASLARADAQTPVERGVQQFRDMLKADPWANPGNLDVDRGAALWKRPRGPKAMSMDGCDLGRGPGIVVGAFAELPRYFADVGRVMDLETRLVWCMETLQGLARTELIAKPYPASGLPTGDIGAMAAYVAAQSTGMVFAPSLGHVRERQAVTLGQALFHRRQGPMDFSCATCHNADGKRIRLQELAHLTKPDAARRVIGEWPAYRVSSAHTMSMQHRIYDCYWQMRLPEVQLGSDVTVALIAYLTSQAAGGVIAVPGLKR